MKGTLATVKTHWPEYLMEASGLGIFMVSACAFGVLLFHPDSYLAGYDAAIRNTLMGVAMGTTAIAIFKSPWGKRSGAHINPVVTLTFYRLGRIAGVDAIFYSIAQFAGAIIGVFVSWIALGEDLTAKEVNFVATVPGMWGTAAAFAGEFAISFAMMAMVLVTGYHKRLSRFTSYGAGLLLTLYIATESPISGTSLNPARTLGSAIFSGTWTGWWIYFTAPTLAMLGAAEFYLRAPALKTVLCARLGCNERARANDVARSPLKFKPVKGLF